MRALFYEVHPVGWVTCKWLKRFWPGCVRSSLNGLSLRQVDPPALPGDDWVRVRTLLGGICGTDLAILAQQQPPNSILQAFSSMPMILGHENVGIVEDIGPSVDPAWKHKRVCVDPTLCCEVRGITPVCDRCRQGQFGSCENFGADGDGSAGLPPGTSTGYNRATGGSFGEYFVAHCSQLVAVPDALSDAQALLTDPVACSVHAALRVDLADAKQVLVYGAGVLGLGLIAAMRALGYTERIDTLDRWPYLEERAANMGASSFFRLPRPVRQRFEQVASRTGATVNRARFGSYMLSGGYDVIFDCVGSARSFAESLKWTRARGQVVMVGTGCGGKVDLTPIWFRELNVLGAYGRQMENLEARRIGTYQLVHEWMLSEKLDVGEMLTHTFPLSDYRTALEVAMNKPAHQAVKVAFEFR